MVSVLVNEFKKVNMYKDNSVEIVLNLGEINIEQFKMLYDIKKRGTCKILISNIDSWVDSVQTEAESLLQ